MSDRKQQDEIVEQHFNELLGRLVSAACQPASETGAPLGRYTRDCNAWGRKFMRTVVDEAYAEGIKEGRRLAEQEAAAKAKQTNGTHQNTTGGDRRPAVQR